MDIHLDYSSYVTVELYSKRGDFGGYEFSRAAWFKVGSAYIRGRGLGSPTPLPQSIFENEIEISPFEKRSFYIALDKPYLLSGGSRSPYGISAENPELAIYHGSGIGEEEFEYPIYPSRVWNGAIHYDTIEKETLPSGSGLTEAVASATDRLLWTTMTGKNLLQHSVILFSCQWYKIVVFSFSTDLSAFSDSHFYHRWFRQLWHDV